MTTGRAAELQKAINASYPRDGRLAPLTGTRLLDLITAAQNVVDFKCICDRSKDHDFGGPLCAHNALDAALAAVLGKEAGDDH